MVPHGSVPDRSVAGSAAPGCSSVRAQPSLDPRQAVDALAAARPYLIGVRHHSPALATLVPALLEQCRPQAVLIEMPPQFTGWTRWLGHPDTRAPVALAGSGQPLPFYPFADFSPELVAIRWALAHDVEVVACDLPLTDRGWRSSGPAAGSGTGVFGRRDRFARALHRSRTGRDADDLWDRVVEAPAPGSSPEQVRRAALAVGWALRADDAAAGRLDPVDLARETQMRAVAAEQLRHRPGTRIAVLTGAFHSPAVAADRAADPAGSARRPGTVRPVPEVTTSLVPYADPLLDSRSGYPAGIRDPRWQAEVLRAGGDPARLSAAVTRIAVEICSRIRAGGHPAGPGEAREVVRVAEDLARLRDLPAPGRGELVEALTTVLAQGESLGRGRVVARAMEEVLIGERRGRLAPGTPHSGLGPALAEQLRSLRLPGPQTPRRRELRLDPLRSPLDRRREVLLRRIDACGIPYAVEVEVEGVGSAPAITTRWVAEWTPACAARTEIAGLLGVSPQQAAEGALRRRRERERTDGGSTAGQVVEGLAAAAGCGLVGLSIDRLADLAGVLPGSATLPELLAGLDLLARLADGAVPGMLDHPLSGSADVADQLHAAAVRQVEGLAGSTDPADARALLALAVRHRRTGARLRLDAALARLADGGSPLMRGAGAAIRVLLGSDDAAGLGERAAGWLDLQGPGEVTGRLTGLLIVAGPLLEAGGEVLEPLLTRLERLPDEVFLRRLPALRGGFDVLTPAARDRLMATVQARLGTAEGPATLTDPQLLRRWARADAHAARVLRDQGLAAVVSLAPPDRWRLVLGRDQGHLEAAARDYGAALDELYGGGRGEGAVGDLVPGAAVDAQAAAYPGARAWAQDLTRLFGTQVREEVLAAAAAQGRVDAALAIDPARVRPSVELLTGVLSLAGALPEATVARLRPLVAAVVGQLTRQLARTMSPALTGLAGQRPTRRPAGPLDLERTIRANLRTARPGPPDPSGAPGRWTVVPEQPVFRTRSRRSTDWRIVLLVDVSGSMETSTVWSAITAAVLSGVPALSTHLLAFSTEVIDLTGTVDDPLALLLEVRVGGGTSIATAVAAARDLITVPGHTMVVVISDFEEGGAVGPLLAEVRLLVDAGVRLLGCAGLDGSGAARYSVSVAGELAAAGMPVAALSPGELARWVGEQMR